jgi:hypothetical protein
MSEMSLKPDQVDYLLSPAAIRDRAKAVFDFTEQGKGLFSYHPQKLKSTVDYVLNVIKDQYPDLKIPFHSRWGHFRAGGIDRAGQLRERIRDLEKLEQARLQLDLVITSVLLDAGAGATWRYGEKASGKKFSRSEGLGVASYHMFLQGAMSSDGKSLRADASGLKQIKPKQIEKFFQVSKSNPLLGVEGRAMLLNNLGQAMEESSAFRDSRPGNLIDFLANKYGGTIPASGILRAVLDGFGSIWPGRLKANGVNLGDVWRHSKLHSTKKFESLVPLHKLSQWMTYSLIEPIQDAGFTVTGIEELTGLAEYRNGGLLLDSGLLTLKSPKDADRSWTPSEDLIIEWRALTVHLLDRIGEDVRLSLGKSVQDFPLAKVLEGGTWWAGRRMAFELRKNGEPPLKIESDGTVF